MSKETEELRLNRCNLADCEAMCCHDGVWLSEEDLEKIQEAKALGNSDFFFPEESVVMSKWSDGDFYPKTAVREFNYLNPNWPEHFPRTRCAFADDQGLCGLELLARSRGENPWRYKPQACWLHPLTEKDGELLPPPFSKDEDPYNLGLEYPGFSTQTPCGSHQKEGDIWHLVLFEELLEHQLRTKARSS